LPLAEKLPHPVPALIPLVLVGSLNRAFTGWLPALYTKSFEFPGLHVEPLDVSKVTAIWSIEGALVVGILAVTVLAFGRIKHQLATGINLAIGGAMLASLNTASEYGFGAVISALPGFKAISNGMAHALSNPLLNEAVTTTTLSGVTGSASGGMSIALATMGQTYLEQATRLGISPEVLHRVAAMASGGMDTLPHNGAVITLLAITGLTHKQAYKDIFAMTLIKTMAVFVVIACYSLFHIV
jgi:H+/gluconate symporter-like permease